mmetsp:Transcript_16979/g.43365  ORF Transcript_16979/g.43365 Transcript_16979/m.43365 type:complete len:90 (-) Transcript_16979:759-1028(-)
MQRATASRHLEGKTRLPRDAHGARAGRSDQVGISIIVGRLVVIIIVIVGGKELVEVEPHLKLVELMKSKSVSGNVFFRNFDGTTEIAQS